MAQQRRTPSGGPGGSRRPGRPAGRARPRQVAAVEPEPSRRPSRFTGRAAVLVLVVSVLTVSYASSLKAYFQQRSHLQDLKAQIASSETQIAALEKEKARWKDPAYVREQARARFGYLMPGQTSYVVIGDDGKPLQSESTLSDPSQVILKHPTAWWTTEWKSVELAGNPPTAEPGHR